MFVVSVAGASVYQYVSPRLYRRQPRYRGGDGEEQDPQRGRSGWQRDRCELEGFRGGRERGESAKGQLDGGEHGGLSSRITVVCFL